MSSPADKLPEKFNAAEYFIDRHLREGRGEKPAIECGERRVTYAGLHASVNRTGNALLELGVRMEERVFLLLQDGPEFFYSFFGAIKIGAVPVPVNTLLKPADYEFLLNDCRARVAIVSQALLPNLEEIPAGKVRFLQHVVVVHPWHASEVSKVSEVSDGVEIALKHPKPLKPSKPLQLDFAILTDHHSGQLDPAPTHKDDACFWLYSSGSTGFPKGCVHLQHDMVVTSELYAKQVLGIGEDDRFFSVAKLFFAYGLGNAGYFPLAVGGTSILLPGPPTPVAVFEIIEKHRPSLFFSVPSNFAALLAHTRAAARALHDFDLSSVRWAVSAGEALPAAIFERFRQRFGVQILDAIGSTEALHMFIANAPGAVRPGSSGRLIPGCEARILDEHGAPVPTGEIGNLYIQSDAVCSCYWNQHEKTKGTIEGHWIRTGDKYRQDEDGYYWYAGRSDDMLKVSGVWVSPTEIEATLIEHPEVQEVAVVGRRDGDNLLKPAAYVVLRDGVSGGDTIARELQQFVISRLAVYKRPRWIEFVPELPKTATGKVQRFKLRQRA
ncbi:MAG TPA: benzoate-CoA ligase family protein [Terriglobales bacterium]|nr:benzoate-CoA ligase family protein [Terriglobales bacterium]